MVQRRIEKLRDLRIPKLSIEEFETDSRISAHICPISGAVHQPIGGTPLTDQEVCESLDWMLHTIRERGLQPLINFFANQRQKAVA